MTLANKQLQRPQAKDAADTKSIASAAQCVGLHTLQQGIHFSVKHLLFDPSQTAERRSGLEQRGEMMKKQLVTKAQAQKKSLSLFPRDWLKPFDPIMAPMRRMPLLSPSTQHR